MNDLDNMIIDELYIQSQTYINYKEDDDNPQYFGPSARVVLINTLINQGIEQKKYYITFAITQKFIGDLLRAKNLAIFDVIVA